jgi:thiol-disulfide isomerase/thioredoxin
MKTMISFLLVVAFTLAPATKAAELGDPAARLIIAEWVKGKPVDLAAARGKQIVVVEFWATWCPPCRTSIPHLTQLQKKFRDKDVLFVGVSDEKASVVKPFVEKMAEKMDYAVAVDDNRKTSKGYMEAYGANGIPHAFVVDKQGRIIWQGHPMTDLEKTLDDLVAGKLDLNSSKQRARGEQLLQQYYRAVQTGSDEKETEGLIREIQVIEKETGGLVHGQAFDPTNTRRQIQFQTALRSYQGALFSGKSDVEVARLEKEAEKLAPKEADFPALNANLKLQSLFTRYLKAFNTGDAANAEALGKQLTAASTKNYQLLNEMAWTLLTDDSLKKRDVPMALKLAKSAYDGCDGKEPAVLDTYARALFDSGDLKNALECQRKALELATDPEIRQQIEDSLRRYEAQAKSKN